MSSGPDAPDPLIGLSIGNYAITARIGAGGMGAVYLAQHPDIGRKVAVKVLLPEHSQRQDLITRFFNEAKTAATLRHPAIVEVFDYGFLPDGAGYLVMDFLEGESLAARLQRVAPLAPEAAAEIARQLAAGVEAAHGQGIVHRDLKPDNVFLVPDPELPEGERVKILDFGIAKLMFGSAGGSKGATSTGMLMGTPLYMAPEQCRGAGQVDHRADVYSTGCILYEMLSGLPPFNHEGVGEILAAHLHQPPRPLGEIDATIPAPLVDIVMRALAKDPGARQQTMAALASELQAFLRGGRPSEAHPRASHPRLSAGLATPSSARRSGPGAAPPARTSVLPGVGTAPTTFSAAAGETPAPAPLPAPPTRKSRAALVVTAGVVVALGAAAVVVWPRIRPGAAPPSVSSGGPTPTVAHSPDKPAAVAPAIVRNDPANAERAEGEDPGTATDPAPGGDPGKAADPAPAEDPGSTDRAQGEDPAAPDDPGKREEAAQPDDPAKSDETPGKTTRNPPPRARDKPSEPSRGSALAARAFEHRLRGDEVAALRTYRQALRAGGLPAGERAEVEGRIIDLQRKFGEIEITSSIAGARVSIDGRDHGATPLPEPVLVRPGSHQVVLSLPGYQPNRRSVVVAAGRKEIVQLRWSR